MAYAQTAEDILSRYFAAASNDDIEKWSQIKTLYATAESYYSTKGFEFQDSTFNPADLGYKKLYKRWPNEQKEVLFSDSLFKNQTSTFFFFKDRRVIMLDFMDPFEVGPDEKSTFDFYPLRIQNYVRHSKRIHYNGIKSIPDKSVPCHEIEITTNNGDHFLLFNTETHLLDAIYFPESDVYWIISDYKIFEGYLIPTHIASMKNGVIFSWTKYLMFAFNVEFEKNTFKPNR
ncbi:MAG: hypothetical protein KIT62_01280 [Cyclobacteriaceae bacterium]|nr:hypothetical protein [Cyclobacteriaceae bacterium]